MAVISGDNDQSVFSLANLFQVFISEIECQNQNIGNR